MPADPTALVAQTPVIPVLTIERAADAVPLARALVAGGLPVIEVTLRTKAAIEAVKAIAAEVPDCVVGVGTVTRVPDIAMAIAAGAKYLVSPGTPPELAAALAEASVPVLPGCATVSEAMALSRARLQGAEVLPRRSLRRHRVAQVGRGAAARAEILSDRRDRCEQHRGLSRLPERARGRRLVGRPEGCGRGRRFRPHHAARARGRARARTRRMSARRPRRAFDWSAAVIATLAFGSAAFVYFRDGQARFLAILVDDCRLFGTMLPKVLAGCLIGAFVTLLLPRETIVKWVGADSGIGGILVATVAGAILPGGPFTIYPVAGAFLIARRGCRRGLRVRDLVDPDRLHPRDRVGAALLRARLRHLAHPVLAPAADPRRPARALCLALHEAGRAMNLAIDIALWTIVVGARR